MKFLTMAAVAAALCMGSIAHADPITFNAAGPYTVVPSSDTLALNAGSADVQNGQTFSIDGTFYVGYSPIPDQNIPFSLDEVLTVNGVTQTVAFNAVDYVTEATDYVLISALGPISFGNATLNFGSAMSDPGGVGASLPVRIPVTYGSGIAATPEPSSLLLLGTGALSAAAAYRRRFL